MLLIALLATVMAVAVTGWRAVRDLEQMEQNAAPDPGPVLRRAGFRLVSRPLTSS